MQQKDRISVVARVGRLLESWDCRGPWTTKSTKVSIEVTHDDGGTQLLGLLSDTLEFDYALTIVISIKVSTGKVYSNDRQKLL